ncbi:HNH endonuclease [Desulfuromonas acetoxidans]|uniref:HNH nuclease n=1 Tax=Desulfuromonas acetoxidans (strain DSM 684 / 11070) TaxID=281689 RepID=Q1JZ28_DESA6|nr:HNH endonuclease signature motif containing protein [Desulfuromonas acetoxidans]EAT15466.1 HNH nuclease [Desulfuromonas acetoxidans DSM 684]MBF0646651.1 HNH endonuclease [Desulfuromonas acetoxidans]NVD25754.1 HNH endonuclease [Desulfuromonas acetoxidans]NVE17732.1 HNH endonuclease [Desulfuromonas acetoxidans]
MLKLKQPAYSSEQAIEMCRQGITGNDKLLQKVDNDMHLLQASAVGYAASASAGELYTLPSTPNGRDCDPVVVEQLKKSDLLKLYSTYFVKEGKPARVIYNALMAAANEKCPFCGGIGRPRNLDHFLPKAHYPQFSVLPVNLVPSCRDCNMDGKGENFATSEAGQVLQPYLDNERYFNEQWIFARYIADTGGEPGGIEYFVQPPEHWEDTQKLRVKKHFNDFNLDLRFSKEAGPRLVTYLAQIQALLQIPLELEVAKNTILQPAIDAAPFVNHWERIMCLALMAEVV